VNCAEQMNHIERFQLYLLYLENGNYIQAAFVAAQNAYRKGRRYGRSIWIEEVQHCLENAGLWDNSVADLVRRAELYGEYDPLIDYLLNHGARYEKPHWLGRGTSGLSL